ncbi:FAD-binding domain-containing protein [Aspergillus caelatus]|uniref:FAD-binding domain-containing protein n=1 Tax=Aspergillus caelatus TaxID=61420 RepID=A0A5N7AP06_9EURO|nr:FAD-binding domain-containing protein [Aspergillus caelatus]KAE8370460.1 FAD-binding domain-containing protein [Aspergillus caelatus]
MTAALPWVVLALACAASATPSQTSNKHGSVWPEAINDLVYGPSWPNFVNKTQRWSTYDAPTFDLVFLPETEEELSQGLQFMSKNQIPWLVAKAGGHGYSATLEIVQDAVMINMEKFNYAKLNTDNGLTVGGGASFRDLTAAAAAGGRELTIGSCPCVGATGAMLGGGVGRLQGLHGLTSDAVRDVRLALWNGTIIDVSADSHPDLFWGMRGAGQNFGIVIETTFETWPATNGGLQYDAFMTFSADSVEPVIEAMNSLFPVNPNLALVILFAINAETLEPFIAIDLVYSGPAEEGQKYTQQFANYSMGLMEEMIRWEDLGDKSAGGAIMAKCLNGQSHSMWDSITADVDVPTFSELLTSFGTLVAKNPGLVNSTVLLEIFGQQGIDAHPANFSAFPHRGELNNMVAIEMAYTDDSLKALSDDWARSWRDRISFPAVGGYSPAIQYQNYAHGDEPLSNLYGTQKWRQRRLTDLKRRYDPHGFFNGYHAVPRDVADWN